MTEPTWRICLTKERLARPPVTLIVTVSAPSAQEACKALVDLTTNNTRVVAFSVERIEASEG